MKADVLTEVQSLLFQRGHPGYLDLDYDEVRRDLAMALPIFSEIQVLPVVWRSGLFILATNTYTEAGIVVQDFTMSEGVIFALPGDPFPFRTLSGVGVNFALPGDPDGVPLRTVTGIPVIFNPGPPATLLTTPYVTVRFTLSFPLFTVTLGDGHMLGASGIFERVDYVLTVAESILGEVIVYEYWNGDVWGEFLPETPINFTIASAQTLRFFPPWDWQRGVDTGMTFDASIDLAMYYWIRVRKIA
mgnify:CR=1 FL=1